ncbi:MAG: AI-2E family transporter, partial [Vicinamibacterales bacterium]
MSEQAKPATDTESTGEPEPISLGTPVDVRSVTLSVLAGLGAILMLQYARPVLIPVVVGVLISYVLGPAVTSMENRGVPRILGAFVVISLLCSAIGLGAYTLTDEAMAIV